MASDFRPSCTLPSESESPRTVAMHGESAPAQAAPRKGGVTSAVRVDAERSLHGEAADTLCA